MEHTRNLTHKFCDTKLVMIIDKLTGIPEKFGEPYCTIGTIEDALEFVKNEHGNRNAILKLDCIAGFEI